MGTRLLGLCVILGTLGVPVLGRGAWAEPMRAMRYTAGGAEQAREWRARLRAALFERIGVGDLAAVRAEIPLDPEVVRVETRDGYTLREVRLAATPGRRFACMVATPAGLPDPAPAVVAIHGHGSDRHTPFDGAKSEYKEFGSALARNGFVVISTDVGQHEAHEAGRTLMGERLWDLMRCVDYLETLPEVDPKRMGCAGLSLGGEMAMWLGAMDERMRATVSSGFLTLMDQMEQNHCMCWKFEGLRELVDFPDIYALTAPRALQCQNGRQEPPTQFTVELAEEAMREIRPAYADAGAAGNVELLIHDGGHEIALGPMVTFLRRHLGAEPPAP